MILILSAVALSSAPASPAPGVSVAHRSVKTDPYAYAVSDQSGDDCTPKHAISVELLMGGQHWGRGRKYMDLQIVGKDPSVERPFYAKSRTKQFVVCKVLRVVFDRYRSGKYVNPVYTNYFPRRPGLSAKGTVPKSSNQEVSLIAFGRFQAKR